MKVFTTLFEVDSIARLEEFKFCIGVICSLDFIERYYIYFEGDIVAIRSNPLYSFLNNEKVNLIQINERPTYKVLIDYANGTMPNEICGILNADIYFDYTMKKLLAAPMDNRFYAITRINRGEHQNPGSQDVWVFRTPLSFSPDIYMGINGCDSFLAQKAMDAGYKVTNPCLTIPVYHNHAAPYTHRVVNLDSGDYWAANGYRSVEVPYSHL
jgi:hypothetical protein